MTFCNLASVADIKEMKIKMSFCCSALKNTKIFIRLRLGKFFTMFTSSYAKIC